MTPRIFTYTGRSINPFEMRPEDIDINDIAHGLSLINRFNGQTGQPISVAQHSVYCALMLRETPHCLPALLHDAAEAYTGDVTKWVKGTPEMAAFRDIEDRNQRLIFKKFGCPEEQHEEVYTVDRIMVRFEGTKGFAPHKFVIDHPDYPPLTTAELDRVGRWRFWDARYAEREFLWMFHSLTGRVGRNFCYKCGRNDRLEIRDYSPVLRDGEVWCHDCNVFVRTYDAS